MTARFSRILLCGLVSGCAHTVTISYPPEAVIHPVFNKPYTIWEGQRVRVDWTPSVRADSFEYLAAPNSILLAESIHQRGQIGRASCRERV